MEYKKLGSSGLMMSALSYGSWITFDSKSAQSQRECMHIAYDHGVNFLTMLRSTLGVSLKR